MSRASALLGGIGGKLELKLLLVGFACVVAGGLSIVTFLKWREVKALSRWLPAPGKIIASRVEAREVRSLGHPARRAAMPPRSAIFRRSPSSTRSARRHFRVRATACRRTSGISKSRRRLRGFPAAPHVTVFYNPGDPAKAVIERTMPEGAFKFMVQLSAGLVIGALVLVFSVGGVLEAIGPHLPKPQNLGAAALLLFMGLFILRMGFAQKSLAEQAAKWPVAAGRIDASGLQAIRTREHSRGYRRLAHRFQIPRHLQLWRRRPALQRRPRCLRRRRDGFAARPRRRSGAALCRGQQCRRAL